jgi:hypothetical protein
MDFRSIVQRFWAKAFQSRRASLPRANKHSSARLIVEELETRTVMSTTDGSFQTIMLNALRNDPTYSAITGAGIGIANIDTGIYYQNPDLQANVVAWYDAVINNNPSTDLAGSLGNAYDPEGRGSFTAGIAASSNPTIGIAYQAKIVAIRAVPAASEALPQHDPILTALQWVSYNADRYNIKVVNLSASLYTSNVTSVPALDSIGQAIKTLESRGIAVVIGSGDNYASFAAPGVARPSAFGTFTVANTWAKNTTLFNTMISAGAFDAGYWATETQGAVDQFAASSQRSQLGNQVVAPGQEIYSTWTNLTEGLNGNPHHNIYSGTAVAAPMVTGMIALMQQAALRFGGRYLSIAEINSIVLATANTITDSNVASNGRVENGQPAASAQNLPETGSTYKRINIYNAVQAVRQLFGVSYNDNTIATAIDLGAFNGNRYAIQPGAIGTDGVVQIGAGDVDLYKITLTSPGVITANIAGVNVSTGFYPFLRLFNSTGTQLDSNYNPNTGIYTGFLANASRPAGVYYIGVSAFDNDSYNATTGSGALAGIATGTYQLTLTLSNADYDGILPGAFPLTGLTNAITRNIGNDPAPINSTTPIVVGTQDVDIYSVVAPDNGNLVVDLNITDFTGLPGIIQLDPHIRVFNDQGVQIASAASQGIVTNYQLIVPNVQSGQTYYIGVSDYRNTSYSPTNPAGRAPYAGTDPVRFYKIKAAFTNQDQNGTPANAVAANFNTPLNLAIGSDPSVATVGANGAKDVDFFTLTAANQPNLLKFTAVGSGGFVPSLALWKLHANGTITKIATTTRANAQLIYFLPADETIFVSVTGLGNDDFDWYAPGSGSGGMTGSYVFEAALLSTNDLPTLTDNFAIVSGNPAPGVSALTAGSVVLGNLGRDGDVAVGNSDVDYYKFIATATQTLNFHLNLSADGSANTVLSFLDSDGDLLKSTGDGDASNTHKDLRVQVVAGQTYFLRVTGIGLNPFAPANSMGNYVLSVFAIGPAGTIATDKPAFNWAPVDDASSYSFLVLDITNNTVPISVTNLSGTSYSLTTGQELTPGHTYRWWVGSVGSNGATTYSGPLDFQITPLAAPAQIGPIGNIAASNGYDRPTFSWSAVPNAGYYFLYVVDAVTNAPVINQPHINGLSYQASVSETLTPGRSYLWYAVAFSVNGQAYAFAPAGQTFTLANLPAPTLNGPSGTIAASAGYDTPTFSWNASTAAHHYWLYVVNTTTNKPVIDKQNLNVTSYATTVAEALTPGHSYIWYVLSFSNNGQAFNYVPGQTFSLANLPAPTLNGPSGAIAAAAGYDRPTFSWNAVPGAHHYWLYVVDTTTNKPAIDRQNLTGTSYTPSVAEALTPGRGYIWYIVSFSTNGLAYNYLPGQTFSLANLAAPSLNGPSGTIAPIAGYDRPTFLWTSSAGAARYWLYVVDTTINQPVIDLPNLTGTSFTPSAAQALTPGHNFIWYVLAFSTNGLAYNFLPGQTFSLAALPSPVLSAPTGSINQTTPTFTWSSVPSATRYAVYVLDLTTNQSPSGIVYTTDTNWTPTTALTRGRTYRWWVASVSANGSLQFVANALDFTITN